MRGSTDGQNSGGLGHFAVLWAVALGAEVYVLSHSPSKKDDALKMGAKHFIVTSEEGLAQAIQLRLRLHSQYC